jgi:predicted transcriptional regulator
MNEENKLNQEITLAEYLKKRGITVDDCAKETKINAYTLYGIWKGQKLPSRKNEKILTKYTGGLVKW